MSLGFVSPTTTPSPGLTVLWNYLENREVYDRERYKVQSQLNKSGPVMFVLQARVTEVDLKGVKINVFTSLVKRGLIE